VARDAADRRTRGRDGRRRRAAHEIVRTSVPVQDVRPDAENDGVVIVLGIDPGLANTGFGVVQRRPRDLVALDGGVIATGAREPLADRLTRIHRVVGELLEHYRPDAVSMESLYFGRNATSALAVGQARGVALLAAAQRGIDCIDYTPQQIKGAVCGRGGADKAQVQRMVQALLRLDAPPTPDHAADALAAAICHANHAPLRAALSA
jgi:crossover junction endodeoxyribonuclease RuvC